MEEIPRCKVVLLGDGRVGKTCLLHSYANSLEYLAQREDYTKTLLENYELVLPVYGLDYGPSAVRLSSWDTAGQEEYDELRRMCYSAASSSPSPSGALPPVGVPEVSVFVLCFAWDDPSSLTSVQMRWYREVRRVEQEAAASYVGLNRPRRPFRVLLCGTKYDLRTDADQRAAALDRLVTREQAYGVMQSIQADALVVCSAKTGFGVRDVFHTAMQQWLQEQDVFAAHGRAFSESQTMSQEDNESEGSAKKGICQVF